MIMIDNVYMYYIYIYNIICIYTHILVYDLGVSKTVVPIFLEFRHSGVATAIASRPVDTQEMCG